jgi:alginate O-acetyltransferase complex protein AlgI
MAAELLVAALAALLLMRWVPDTGARREWLLLAVSSAVLVYWQPLTLLVTLGLALGTWALLREHTRSRLPRTAIVAILVVALIVLRVAPEVSWAFAGRTLPWPIPLGISFLVLRLIGVVMDASALGVPVGPRRLLLLSLFFPTFRAGPITTLESLHPLAAGSADRWRAMDRIVLGLARKCLLADLLFAVVVRPWTQAAPAWLTPEQCLLFPFLLGLWIYWDFAGYSDIAIGAASLLGYHVPENFDRPYQSRNLVEFWRRWHITLGDWIRSRVFLKLSGRRPSTARVCAAAVASMALCGLWHGPRGGLLVWGLCHGVGLAAVLAVGAVERRQASIQEVLTRGWAAWLATALTYVWVNLAWLPFFLGVQRGWEVAAKGAAALLGARGALLLGGFVVMLIALSRLAAAAARTWREGAPEAVRGAAYAIVLVGLFASGAEPFVYFRF